MNQSTYAIVDSKSKGMFNLTLFARIFYDTQGYTHILHFILQASCTQYCLRQVNKTWSRIACLCPVHRCHSIYQALMSKYSSPKNVTTTVRSANFLPASAASAFCAEAGSSYLT